MQLSKIWGMLHADLEKGLSALGQAGVPLPAFSKAVLCVPHMRTVVEKRHRSMCTCGPITHDGIEGQSSVFFLVHVCGKALHHRFSGELMEKPTSLNIAIISEHGWSAWSHLI